MSKYLIFQDGHCKAKNSVNRKGDYFTDWLIKFDELISIAKENKVKAIIDNGDLLDSPEPSYKVLDEIADRIEKAKILVLSLYGNHCMRYRNEQTSKYTGLAHLFKRSKYFLYLPDYNLEDMEVIAVDYATDIEEKLKTENLLNFKSNKFRVGFIHAFVCETPFPFALHVCCNEIKNSGNCIIFLGHYHKQFNVKINTAEFLNIGCFGRNSVTEANIKPSCVLLDTDTRSYKVIELKSAKAGHEVFDLEKIEESKNKEANLIEFIKSLENISYQESSIINIIKQVGQENNIDKSVINLIQEKINEIV